MTHTPSNPDAADLSYLKRLANAGRGGAAPFLPLMAVFGLAFGVSFLLVYASIVTDPTRSGGSGSPFYPYSHYVPALAHLAFLATALWTGWRLLVSRGRGLSRTAAAAWTAAFLGLVVTVIGFTVFTNDQPPTDSVYASYMQPTVLLALWGGAWWTTAVATDRRWLLVVALASYAAAIAAAAIGNSVNLLLLTGACLIGLAFVPAVLLMRERGR